MKIDYVRVPLVVDALFMTDGTFYPKKLYYNDMPFEIAKVINFRRYCPRVVGCIAPIEYTVMIDMRKKKIYYEPDTNTWFSIKEVYVDERKSNPA